MSTSYVDIVPGDARWRRATVHMVLRCRRSLKSWMVGLEPAYPDWLIDVDQACLVPFSPEKTAYFALSYTGGQTMNLRNKRPIFSELQQSGVSHFAPLRYSNC